MFSLTFRFLPSINYRIYCYRNYSNIRSPLKFLSMSNANAIKENLPLTATVLIQVVGSGAVGVPNSVILINGSNRYLINCGEGTQKLGCEYRMNLEKASHVFITNSSWKNVSGLIGLFLSMQESGKKEVFVHGFSGFKTLFPTLNKYIKLRHLQIKYKSCQHYSEFFDGITSVKYVHIYPSTSTSCMDFAVSSLDKEKILDTKKEIKKNSEKNPGVLNESLCSSQLQDDNKCRENLNALQFNNDEGNSADNYIKTLHMNKTSNKCAISYIFKTMPTAGALLLEKCLEYGVPPGPMLGDLKKGNDVTLKNGKVVKSVDVKNPDLPGVDIIAIDCPSENYLDSLLEEQAFHEYQFGGKIPDAVIHFSNYQIVKNLKYQEWINNFPKKTKHLFINEDNNVSGSVGISRLQFKLNYLHPEIFPLFHDALIPDFPRAEDNVTENGHVIVSRENNSSPPIYSDKIFYKCESNSFIFGETMCYLYVKPKLDYDYSKCLVLKKNIFLNEMFKNNNKEKIEECKASLKDLELSLKSDSRMYPKIVFLGTGSSKPSKVRNPSGILIFLDEKRGILLDCGENVYNQLITLYGKQKTSEILRKIHAVYISHLHLDHHLGLITIIKERKLAFDKLNQSSMGKSEKDTATKGVHQEFKPVILLAPEQLLNWLRTFDTVFEEILSLLDFLPNSLLVKDKKELSQKAKLCKKDLHLLDLETTPVHHCHNAFGISLIHESGFKITYSGDTRPCEALVNLGMNSDVLIHEATFEESFIRDAKLKLHSTTKEAIQIGRSMNAKYIILTHFSQRYCYLPVIEKEFRDSNIGIAFDFMEVPFNMLSLLPKLLEPLEYIFSDYIEKSQLNKLNSSLKRKINEADTSNFLNPAAVTDDELNDIESPAKIFKKECEKTTI